MAFQDHFEIILQRVPFFFFLGLRPTYLPNPWSDFGILRPPWLPLHDYRQFTSADPAVFILLSYPRYPT